MSQATELIASQVGSAINNQRTWGSIIFNVKDPQYGAKGNGSTDDTSAVQAAINDAVSKNATLVFFPPGSYKVTVLTNTSTINFVGDNATFVGYAGTIMEFGISTLNIKNTITPVYNVTGYGAVPNQDSTVAIQAAINAASAAGGGEVYIPTGIFLISAKLTCPLTVTIVGNGGLNSELHATAAIDAILDLAGSIKNVYVNGNNMASKGVQLTGDYCYLERCVFAYCVYGIYNNAHDDHRFMNCSTQNNTYGLYSADRLINCFIYGMVAQNNQYGIYVTYSAQQPQALFITQSMFFGNSVRGVYVHKDIFVLCITDCVFDGPQPRGIMLNDLTANLGADITIKNCYVGATEVPIWIGAGYGHVVIDSNRIDNGSYRGLVISAIATVRNSNVTITSNSFGNNGGGDISIDSVDGCWIERNVFGMVSGTNIISAGTFTGTKPFAIVKENNFPAPGRASTFNTRFLDNLGYVTSNQGLGAIGNTFTSVVINHGMDIAPTRVLVTPQGNLGSIWVTNITATQFTVNCSIASSGVTQFSWFAQDKY